MAEPSPADAPEAPEAPEAQGQVPDDGSTPDADKGGQGKRYDEAYVRQLRRESSGYRTRLAEVEEQLEELRGAGKSEVERLTDRLTSSEARAMEAEARLLRHDVAAEQGIPPEAVQFLTGSTREELEHRATELKKLLDAGRPTGAGFDGGARRPVPDPKSPEEAHNDLILRSLGHRS